MVDRKLKTCPHCDHPWPLTAKYWYPYPRTKDGFQGWCRACHVAYAREVRVANATVLRELKCAPCIDCRLSFPPYVMDFDHLPGTDKIDAVSHLARGGGRDRLMAEIPKTEVVCANDHARRTHERDPGPAEISQNQARVRELKESTPCAGCGKQYPYYVMTFSQRAGQHGGADISRMASGTRRWAAIEAEIRTRDIMCANCHRERRWGAGARGTARKRVFRRAGHTPLVSIP